MTLADYLAKNYLSADPKPTKSSKKRKRKPTESGLTIADDDALGWDANANNNSDDDGPLTGKLPPLPLTSPSECKKPTL